MAYSFFVCVALDNMGLLKWGIQLFTVMPTAKDALAQKYPEMAALCCEGWMALRTPASHFLA